jgi:hypothetical protein
MELSTQGDTEKGPTRAGGKDVFLERMTLDLCFNGWERHCQEGVGMSWAEPGTSEDLLSCGFL